MVHQTSHSLVANDVKGGNQIYGLSFLWLTTNEGLHHAYSHDRRYYCGAMTCPRNVATRMWMS